MKKQIILLLSCMVLSSALVFTLYGLSDHQIRKNNSFIRIVLKNPFNSVGGIEIKYNSYYIAGASNEDVYLANITALRHLLVLSTNTQDTTSVTLKIKNLDKLKFNRPRITVLQPYFYITDGVIPSLYRGKLNEWEVDSFMFDDAAYFVDAQPFNSKSFAIRSISSETQENILGKLQPISPYVNFSPEILQKQVDGKFCTDGMLHYDQALKRIVYLYFYRNQFMVMDTSLNLLYRGNTIDTTKTAHVTGTNIPSENSYTMESPPVTVNDKSCVANGLLFIKSPLLSRNEEEDLFKTQSVIDVYDLLDGTYKFSFYIRKANGKSFRDLIIVKNKLIVLYDHYLEIHELNSKYFPTQEAQAL